MHVVRRLGYRARGRSASRASVQCVWSVWSTTVSRDLGYVHGVHRADQRLASAFTGPDDITHANVRTHVVVIVVVVYRA